MKAALLDVLDPQPSDEVLELAAGTGEVASALAGRVGRLLVTDVAPAMVEAAQRRGLGDAEYAVIDMQAIDLPDDSFDKVVCRFGYMLVPDRDAAFRETRRVLRPGGTLAFATWAAAPRNPWATAYGPVLVERGLMEPPAPGEPGQFALGDAATIEAAARAAGFKDVVVGEVEVEFRVRSWKEYAEILTGMATQLRETLDAVDDEARAEIEEAARARLEPYRTDAGYAPPGVALVAVAR